MRPTWLSAVKDAHSGHLISIYSLRYQLGQDKILDSFNLGQLFTHFTEIRTLSAIYRDGIKGTESWFPR